MKYLVLFSFAIVLFSCTSTDKPATREEAARDSLNKVAMADTMNYTTIQWLDSTTQDLGKIKEGSIVEISWKFKNTGTKPLIVADARGTCGCTIADKPKEPIPPGQEGTIKAKFNSQGQGPEAHKTVSVDANTKGQTMHYLTFTAQITKD
ncbi:MAG TPA: DUF1573 domain-containing protein [Flavisolibacter sp.]